MTMTGIPTFSVLEKFVEVFSGHYPDTRTHHLGIKEQIILIFLKLKQDLSFAILPIFFFKFYCKTCRFIYITNIPLIVSILKHILYWTTRYEILNNIPYCFEKFIKTRVVLDCTEISGQRSKCLTCRIKVYSNIISLHLL